MPSNRRGFAVWWLILLVPVLFALFAVVVDMGRVWLARIELTNGLEGAALAGVQAWGPDAGDTLTARQVAVDFADSNTVLGSPLTLQTNYDGVGGRPNQNATCEGNLVFGGITNDNAPFIFDADALSVGCGGPGTVRIEVCKTSAGTSPSTDPRMLGIFFEDGAANLYIRSVSLTVPLLRPNQLNQQPYWDADLNQFPAVSATTVVDACDVACIGNLGNAVPAGTIATTDARGLDPDPQTAQFPGTWVCVNNGNPVFDPEAVPDTTPANWAATGNNAGDICFSFADPFQVNVMGNNTVRHRTVTIHFQDDTFNPPNPPVTAAVPGPVEFVRFAVGQVGFNPPAIPGPNSQNNGDSFARAGVVATVVFGNTLGQTFTCTDRFENTLPPRPPCVYADPVPPIDVENDGRAEAFCNGGGTGVRPAVRATQTVEVPSCWDFFGLNVGPYSITTKSTAVFDCPTQSVRLIHIEPGNFRCTP